jgi:hypothetical protein
MKLKYTILTSLVIILSNCNLKAQFPHFGFKAGVNIANLSGDDVKGVDPLYSYHGGITLRIGLGEVIAIQGEALYSLKGTDLKDSSEINLNYLDFPLILRVKMGEKLRIHAGAQFGMLLSAEEQSDGKSVGIKNQFKTIDYSAVAGIEYELPFGLGFGARYMLSLDTIGDDFTEPITNEKVEALDIKNGVLQIFMAFAF